MAVDNRDILGKIETSILKLDKWLQLNGWAGYDKYDFHAWKLVRKERLDRNFMFRKLVALLNELEERNPLMLRKILKIPKSINEKALGLFLYSYTYLDNVWKLKKYNKTVNELYSIIMSRAITTSSGNIAWGYNFPYNGVVFFPAKTPYAIVTVVVAESLFYLYSTSPGRYPEMILEKICKFFKDDLNTVPVDDGIMISFSPIDTFPIYNSNLWVSSFLVKVGRVKGWDEFLDFGWKISKVPLEHLEKWGYLGYTPPEWGGNHVDNYHTGFNIRAFFNIGRFLEDKTYLDAASKYFGFYLDNFIGKNGEPLRNPKGVYVDSHSAAEAILVSACLSKEFPEALSVLRKVSNWVIENMQEKDGHYIYRFFLNNGKKIKVPFIRWGQAWILRALVEAHKALTSKQIANK